MGTITTITHFTKAHVKIGVSIITGLIVGGVGTTAVLAAIPDSTTGMIHACYQTSGVNAGQVRIIDSTDTSCDENETAISWGSSAVNTVRFVSSLQGADLSAADLRYRDFTDTNLSNTNLTQTNLIGSKLDYANLSGATIGGGNGLLNSATFKHTNLTNALFANNVTFDDADFSNATFSGVTLDHDDVFSRSNFSNIDFTTVHFVNDLSNGAAPSIVYSNLTNADFSGKDLSNVTMQNDNTNGTDFTGVNFTGSFLGGTNLSNATLTTVIWSNTQCSDYTNSDDNGGTCIGHLVP